MDNMKKVYQKPEIEVVEIELQSMISQSVTGEDMENGGDSEGGKWADANRHRGEWGNLWAED